ncbi:MAG: hypothetical protein KDD33_09715 [Bdellovibrionales bacterium]|nr:hypothetical protein [Bdellovibrionales bacterium]
MKWIYLSLFTLVVGLTGLSLAQGQTNSRSPSSDPAQVKCKFATAGQSVSLEGWVNNNCYLNKSQPLAFQLFQVNEAICCISK